MNYNNVEDLTTRMLQDHRVKCCDVNISDLSNELVYIFRCSCGESWDINKENVTGTEWDEIFNNEIGREKYIKSCTKLATKEELEIEERFNCVKAFMAAAKKTKNKKDILKAKKLIQNEIDTMLVLLDKQNKKLEN